MVLTSDWIWLFVRLKNCGIAVVPIVTSTVVIVQSLYPCNCFLLGMKTLIMWSSLGVILSRTSQI